MIRKIIHINEEKCDGCGLCASACHEGAIQMIGGKAKLVREDFCDGLGDCLPACPAGAITFEEREAAAYDEAAVAASKRAAEAGKSVSAAHGEAGRSEVTDHGEPGHSCPGSRMMRFDRGQTGAEPSGEESVSAPVSRLAQWPCQIKLVPVRAPFFDGAKLLIAADCTAFAYARMHEDFMKGKVTIIGCPKLDAVDYTDKLAQIIAMNDIKSVTILRMEVPCCGGLQMAAMNALKQSGKFIPWQVVTISRDGRVLD